MPLPDPAWLEDHLDDAAAFARRVKRGDIRAYGVTEYWLHIEEPESLDPRGVLEIARMHQWPAYALAGIRAQRLGNPEEARGWYHAFMDEVHRFAMYHHPFESPLWAVAMDSALRVTNMLTAFDWFQQANLSDDRDGATITAAAQDHAIVIQAKLETAGGMATSHLLGDLLGLIAVDAYAGRHPEHVVQLVRQTSKQILADGMSFEASTGYHRQVTDILVTAHTILERSGVDLPDDLTHRVDMAAQALYTIERAGMPLIGDNDDGMVFKLIGFIPDTSYLRLQHPEDGVQSPLPSDPLAHHFPDFGLTLVAHGSLQTTARCGPIGQYGKGGHAHNDQNAITVRVNSVPIIVDPGSVWYAGDPAQRNRDRSVRSHATVRIDGSEQHTIPAGGGSALWWLVPNVKASITEATDRSWVGEVAYPVGVHLRRLTFSENMVEGTDVIPAGHTGEIRFPVAPGTVITTAGSEVRLERNGEMCVLAWADPCSLRIANAEVRVAERFGFAETADVLILTMGANSVRWSISTTS